MAQNLNFVIDAKYQAGTAIKKATGDISSLSDAAGRASSSSGGLGKLSHALGVGLKTAALAGTAAIAGIGAVIGKGVGQAMDLEQALANTAAVMGKSANEIAPLKNLVEDLALNPKLKVDAAEAANAVNMLARNGLNMQQILGGAAESTVFLANATGSDFGTAADIATDTMSLFNITAANMMDSVDGIASVVNNSKFSIDDYRLALAQGGGVAATAGVEFNDFNTAIAGIAPLFASGSDAGTSLKVMLQRLVPASNAAEEAMNEVGLTTQSFFNEFGELRSMGQIAGNLKSALSDLSDERRTDALSTIFGTDAMRAAAGMMNLGADGFATLQAEMSKTDAMTSATTRMNTLSGQMDILQGIIESITLSIGDAFLPAIRKITGAFTALLEKHGDKITEFFDAIGETVEAVVDWFLEGDKSVESFADALGVSAGPIQIAVDAFNLLKGAVDKMIQATREGLPGWKKLLIEWGTAAWNWITETAIPTVTTKVGEYIGIIVNAVKNALPGFKTALASWGSAAWTWITDTAIPKVSSTMVDLFETIRRFVTNNTPQLIENLKQWGGAAWTWITGTAIPNITTKMGELADGLFRFITDNAPTVATKFGEWAKKAWGWVNGAWIKLGGKITTLVSNLGTLISNNATVLAAKFGLWADKASGWVGDVWPRLQTSLGTTFTSITNWISGSVPDLAATLVSWFTAFVDFALGLDIKIIEGLTSVIDSITGWIEGDGAKKVGDSTSSWVDALIGWVSDDLSPKVGPELEKLIGTFETKMPEIGEALAELFKSLGNLVKTAFVKAATPDWKAIFLGSFKVREGSLADSLFGLTEDAGTNAGKGFKAGIDKEKPTVFEDIKAFGQGVIDDLNRVLGNRSPSTEFEEAGRNVLRGFRDGISDPNFSFSLDGVVTKLKESFSVEKLGKIGGDAFNLGFTPAVNWHFDNLIPHFKSKGEGLLSSFKGPVSENNFSGIASNVLTAFTTAANSKFNELTGAMSGLAESVKSSFSSVLSIFSPSRVFEGFGENIIQGLVNGLQSNVPQMAIEGVANDLTVPFDSSGGAQPVNNTSNNTTQNIFQVTLQVTGDGADQAQQAIDDLVFRYNGNLASA